MVQAKEHWGTYLWGFIHTICLNEYQSIIIDRLQNIALVFPCSKCKITYAFYLQKLNSLNFNDKLALFYWSVDLHNAVNKKLNKPNFTYQEAIQKWCKT